MVVRLGCQPHAVSDTEVLRPRRDRAVEHLRVRAVRELLEEVVLDGPEAMPAELVGEHRLLERVLVCAPLAALVPWAGDGNLVEQGELHSTSAEHVAGQGA